MKFAKISQIAFSGFLALGLVAASPSLFAQSQAAHQVVKAQKLPDIRSGMTKADVEKILGKPAAAPIWLSGASTWAYQTDLDSGMRYDVDFGSDGKVVRAGLYRVNETGNT
ncbi:outer membrane protein assembly factor BamE [Uliginosibacterium sp. 31-16]|uniref:outer membrane protein assembly factor BamE domain-containing protein n=1 Tax=Uliginosibacterium sp. 31-16 TaxID=3068315 RepID=UPI00273D1D3C|nr:outer membrane protein assembly factor BamE [Uliginosibacterium sp. 31-16]MDP5239474.1 outer membrane protein assembly factor BamE [Uliginosibacterium sp. 31-16]